MKARTLIAHGNSSLTVSLPSYWIKKHHLRKGDQVYASEAGKDLLISSETKDIVTRTKVDISNLDKISALHAIQSAYRYGYDEIEVTFTNTQLIQYPQRTHSSTQSLIVYIVGRLVGAEILEQQKDRVLIKRIIDETNADFLQVLRRIFIMLSDTNKVFLAACEQFSREELLAMKERHDRINNLTNYCLRVLNKNGFPDTKKTCLYYHIIADVDKIIDVYKYIAADLLTINKKPSKNLVQGLSLITACVSQYCELFYKFSRESAGQINKIRWNAKEYILEHAKKMDSVEVMHLTRAEAICEYLLDMTEARYGLGEKLTE